MPIDWEDIKIPEEDADKPADLDSSDIKEDEQLNLDAKENEDTEDNKEEDSSSEDVDEDHSEESDGEDQSDDDEDSGGSETEEDGEDEEEKLTPFHEHPDWKKMMTHNHDLEKQVAKLSGQIEVLSSGAGLDKKQREDVNKTAEQKLEDKLASGWKPKDQLEIVQEYGKLFREELDTKKELEKQQEAEARTKQQEQAKEVNQQISTRFKQLGVTSEADQDKVSKKILEWRDRGMNVSVDTIDEAVEFLKGTGKLSDNSRTNTQTADSKKKEARQKKSQDSVNRKLKKSRSSGKTPSSKKPSFQYIRNNDLDTIIQEQGDALG